MKTEEIEDLVPFLSRKICLNFSKNLHFFFQGFVQYVDAEITEQVVQMEHVLGDLQEKISVTYKKQNKPLANTSRTEYRRFHVAGIGEIEETKFVIQ